MIMKIRTKLALIIALTIIMPTLIISSYFIEDKEQSNTVVFILIAVYLVPFFYLSKQMKRK